MKSFLTTKQVLARLRVSEPTWCRLLQRGEGPPRVRLSLNRWIYPEDALEAWLASRLERPISQQPAE